MKNFTENYALNNLSKRVIEFIRELEQPHRDSNKKDFEGHLERLYKTGEFSKQDYLFAKARILLNRFCYDVEKKIGRDVKVGILFYCQDRKLLCYGAGAHYPQKMKEYCVLQRPSLDLESSIHYQNDVVRLNNIDDWYSIDSDSQNFVPLFKECGIKSMFSKRMRLNGLTFGTIEVYFPHYDGITDEEILYIREKLQPVKEKLYHIREEMIEAVETAIERMGPENYSNNTATFLTFSAACLLPILEGMFPLAGKLINIT
ncbi:hypothetical protein ACSU6B_23435 [Neobacillus sp. C211]|uniref:hypothetical protein n=1 Tax=unclassified Neobacillus TaxID=2675272 RepID=UPI00397E1524